MDITMVAYWITVVVVFYLIYKYKSFTDKIKLNNIQAVCPHCKNKVIIVTTKTGGLWHFKKDINKAVG